MSDTTGSLLHLDHELYDRLFEQRTILLGEPLEDLNTNRLCNALLVLSASDPKAAIRFLINSPGGSVPGMLAIRDTMRAIPNAVATINLGMAYSAGQFLLSSGTPGRRYTMPHARVLLHQGSGGIGGSAMDIAIQADDLRRTRDTVLGCIAEDTGQPVARVEADSRRDRWFDSREALDYGFVDHIMAIYDAMQFVRPAVETTCVGQVVASAAVLLAGGAAGHRQILPHGRVVIHAPATEGRGTIPDLILEADEVARVRTLQEQLLSVHTGRSPEQLREDTERDLIFTPEQAVAYGVVDRVLTAMPGDSAP